MSEPVYAGREPVTLVAHHREDGAWQFVGNTASGDRDPVYCCFHHPIDRDRSLEELADLPLGWCAERAAPGEPWTRRESEPEEG